MFTMKDLLTKEKKKELKDIKLNEVSLVDAPANMLPFLFFKSEAGEHEQLNPLEELIACEKFEEAQIPIVDAALQQLDYLDDNTADAVGNLILAVATNPQLAKNCKHASWPSLTGGVQQDIELPSLIKKGKLNPVDKYFQKFVKSSMQEDELEIINDALETISDLDDVSLLAVESLLKLEWSEGAKLSWPSISATQATQNTAVEDEEDEPAAKVAKVGGLWPTLAGHI